MGTDSTTASEIYGIDDGDSNLLADGLDEYNVWRVARQLAERRGESVWVYRHGVDGAVEVSA